LVIKEKKKTEKKHKEKTPASDRKPREAKNEIT
jgi:hypothetical protein